MPEAKTISLTQALQEKLAGKKLLAVDYRRPTQELLNSSFAPLGIELLFARDSFSAKRLVNEQKDSLALILLNLEMPCLAGDKFCAEIRQDLGLTDIPILIEVPGIDAEILERIYLCGANDYLLYPPAVEELNFKAWNALNSEGSETKVSCINEDLREIIEEHTTPLENALIDAQTSSLSKTQFIANLSHELRTPLNGIIGFTEMMSAGELSEEQLEHFELIKSSTGHLLNLVNDILDFSKIEAGKTALDSIVFDIGSIVEQVVESFKVPITDRRVEVVCEIDPTLPPLLEGDPGKWKQVLHNLVGNAVKFCDVEGGVLILVRGILCDDNTITIETTVTDSGIGIPEEQQAIIFEPFSQLDPTNNRRSGGTGLGLSISAALVKILGGEISVQSKTEVGSRFQFTAKFNPVRAILPEAFATEHQNVFIQNVELPELSILIVEDNKINQKLIGALFSQRGHTVTLVDDGQEAVDKFQGEQFDIILMDCHMPVMDGYEATKQIREIERNQGKKHTPIVAVTAAAFDEDRLHCLRSGMDAVITKPIDSRRLFSKILHLLGDPNDRLGFPT